MKRTFFRRSLGVGLLISVAIADARGADEVDDLLALSLEELLQVKVTVGTLLDSDELHSASNVSVVPAAEWESYGARRTLDAIEHLPATLVVPAQNGTSVVAIRGYAQITSSRGIATSLDGIRLNNFLFGTAQTVTSDINLGVLDRIEMIRGPASAIYGSDAFHGVLAMHAFDSDTDLNRISVEGGDEGYHRLSAQHSSAPVDDVRVNVALASSGQSDQQRRYDLTDDPSAVGQAFIEKEQRYQSDSLSLKLASDPSQALFWSWGLYGDRMDADDFPGNSATVSTGQDVDNLMTRLAVTQKLEDLRSLEASAYYRDSDVERISLRQAGSPIPSGLNLLQEHFYGGSLTLRQSRLRHTQWALSLGYDVQVVDKADLLLVNGSGYDPAIPLLGGSQSREIGSLVLEANSQLSDDARWNLVYGGRLDHYSDFGSQGSPRLGLIFQVTDDSAIKLLYGQAFRAPTAAELYIQPINNRGQQGNPDLEPEIMDTVELVFMRQARTWKASLVLFENRWQDTIAALPVAPGLSTYSNTGRSSAQGVETSLTWLPAPWSVDFNIAYTESYNDETDERFDQFPRLIANLALGYQWPQQDVQFTLSNRAFSETNQSGLFVPSGLDPLPAYFRTDLSVVKHFGPDLEVFLNIINLFDRDNYLPSVFGVESGIPDEPFSFSVGARFQF